MIDPITGLYESDPTWSPYEARMDAQRRPRGQRHTDGVCGGNADLCAACGREEMAALREWAATRPEPLANEDVSAYWRRIGGPFLDGWYSTSAARIFADIPPAAPMAVSR